MMSDGMPDFLSIFIWHTGWGREDNRGFACGAWVRKEHSTAAKIGFPRPYLPGSSCQYGACPVRAAFAALQAERPVIFYTDDFICFMRQSAAL